MSMIANVDVKGGSGSEVRKHHGIRWSNRCLSCKHPSEHSNCLSENASWPLRSRNDPESLGPGHGRSHLHRSYCQRFVS